MSDAKHTPGPWTASIQRSKEGRDLGWIVEHNNGRIGWASLAYANTNREAIASDPAREANARLIAAAPELLAVVQEACAIFDANHEGGDEYNGDLASDLWKDEIHRKLTAALSKATGAA